MPTYKKDTWLPIPAEEVRQLVERAKKPRDKFLIAFLWITGCRPVELTKLYGRDFTVSKDGLYLSVSLYTAKLKKTARPYRNLDLNLNWPLMHHVAYWATNLKPDQKVMPITTTRMRQIIYEISDNKLTNVTFRKNRLTNLAINNATELELKNWKGATDLRSVSPYLAFRPVGKGINIT